MALPLRSAYISLILPSALALTSCTTLPTSGPSARDISSAPAAVAQRGIQLVDVDGEVARRLAASRTQRLFSEALGSAAAPAAVVGRGDALEVTIWEAPPAALFGTPQVVDPRSPLAAASRVSTLPEQVVGAGGFVTVPFAGAVPAAGRTLEQIQEDIAARLKGKANQPQVVVRLARNATSFATVVGDVAASTRVPLTPGGERLLDALAAAGGVRQPVHKMTVQLTRGESVHALPLDTIIRDPRQNIPLHAGDVVTALFQPLSFTALGATGKNEEVSFEATGLTLAQALARAGGLQDARSDAQGVFIFRFEPQGALDWPARPVMATPDGRVPVIYRLDLRDPASFFVAQGFPIENRDILYVSNAPAAELQKFLNLALSVAYTLSVRNVYNP